MKKSLLVIGLLFAIAPIIHAESMLRTISVKDNLGVADAIALNSIMDKLSDLAPCVQGELKKRDVDFFKADSNTILKCYSQCICSQNGANVKNSLKQASIIFERHPDWQSGAISAIGINSNTSIMINTKFLYSLVNIAKSCH